MTSNNPVSIYEPSSQLIQLSASLPPRDIPKIIEDIRRVVTHSDVAEDCIYCKPVGKADGIMQFATGGSVRLAEITMQHYGKLWITGKVEETEKQITATVMCFDLQSLNIVFGHCSKSIIGKYGRYNDQVIETTKAAALSIAKRNAILQQTSACVSAIMEDIKKAIINKWGSSMEMAKQKILKDFKDRFKIDSNVIRKITEKESTQEDKLILLIGIRNYLLDNPDAVSMFTKSRYAGPDVEEPPIETTLQQEYNTIKLQLLAKGRNNVLDKIFSTLGIEKSDEELTDEEYKNVINKAKEYINE